MSDIGKTVGVVGAGSFGSAIGNLLAHNVDVLLYSRQPELVEAINTTHQHFGVALSHRIRATSHIEEAEGNDLRSDRSTRLRIGLWLCAGTPYV